MPDTLETDAAAENEAYFLEDEEDSRSWLSVLFFMGVCGGIAGVVVWLADTILGAVLFYETSFFDLLLLDIPLPALYARVLAVLLAGGAAALIARRRHTHVRTSTAIQEKAKWFNSALNTAGVGLISTDNRGVIMMMNAAAERMTGCSARRSVGKALKDVCTLNADDTAATPEAMLQTVVDTRQGVDLTDCVLFRANDHKLLPVAGQFAPLTDDGGTLLGCIVVLHDLSDRQQSELQKHRLTTVVQQSPDAILITDVNGVVSYVNPAFLELTQIAADDVIDRAIKDFHAVVGNQPFVEEMVEALSRGLVWRGQMTFDRSEGDAIDVEAVVSPIRNAEDATIGYTAIAHDVTNEKAMQEQLRHAHKMDAVGRLANHICHDFNNVLTGVYSFSELIMFKSPADSEVHGYAREINQAALKGSSLTEQLLGFSQQELSPTPDIVSLNHVIDEMEEMLRRSVGEAITFETDLQPMLGLIRASAPQVNQVLLNLCLNARDAMPEGGVVRVETRNEEVANANGTAEKIVTLTVSDTGHGMDPETAERIFEPFFSTRSGTETGGLGLAMVYGFVTRWGLDIDVRTAPGEGTAFVLSFAAVDETDEQIWSRHSIELPSVNGRETILIVDDEDLVRLALCEVLQSKGYTVLQAENGDQAIALGAGRSIDVLISDVVMPGMTATELARQYRQTHKSIKVIFMSGHTGHPSIAEAMEDEQAKFLAKPIMPGKLLRTVRKLLDKNPERSVVLRRRPPKAEPIAKPPAPKPPTPQTKHKTVLKKRILKKRN